MSDMVTYDFTLDDIISVRVPKGTNPYMITDMVIKELMDMIKNHGCSLTFNELEEYEDAG